MPRSSIASIAILLIASGALASDQGSVGRPIADFSLPDGVGKVHSLSDQLDSKLVVVAFLGTECPLAKLYGAKLQRMADEFGPQGVAFLAIDSNSQDSLAEITAFARRRSITFPVLKDQRNKVADQFGAARTPEVFLLDRGRVIRYQGRVDDQYLIGVVRDEPTTEELRAAISELLAGKPVSQPFTKAVGCVIGRTRKADPNATITYTRDIAPIFQERCVECHREGEIGPFPLRTYEQAEGWGEMISEVIQERRMPPWHASPDHGKFANDRSMPDEEMQLVHKWVEQGCPEGDPADMPPARTYTTGWQLPRKPDVIVPMAAQPFKVPADGGPSGIPYQYFKAPSGFQEDRWVSLAEVQPGNREVVHHIIVYVQPPGGDHRRDWTFLTAYVPGLRNGHARPDVAKLVPAGSEFIFEMHYTPNGSPQQDISRLGLLFTDAASVKHEVITVEVGNTQFVIPPFEPAHRVTASSRLFPEGATLISLSPHMHLRGKAFRYELATPDGKREVLLDVPAYDFNWQTRYVLAQPRPIPAGAVLHCTALFDNSPKNLANPDPAKAIRWGDQSWDEMMLGYFDLVLARDDTRTPGQKPVSTGLDLVGMFDSADEDSDGGLTREEAAGNELLSKHFAAVDRDRDQRLQLGEILTALHAQQSAR